MGAGRPIRAEVIEKQCRPLLTDQQKEEGSGGLAVFVRVTVRCSQRYGMACLSTIRHAKQPALARSLARWECHLVLVFRAPRDPIPSLQCGQVNGISGRELRGAAWFEEASH